MENQQQINQPIPTPPTQAKWWPIDWKYNKSLKISGFISTIFILVLIFLILIINLSPDYKYPNDPEGISFIITVFPFGFFSLIIWLPAIIINLVSYLKQKNPDRIDKLFFWINALTLLLPFGYLFILILLSLITKYV